MIGNAMISRKVNGSRRTCSHSLRSSERTRLEEMPLIAPPPSVFGAQLVDEHVFDARLDLAPLQLCKRADGALELRTIDAGDMDRAPKNAGSFDAGHRADALRDILDILPYAVIGDEPRLSRHIERIAFDHDAAIGEVD